MKKQSTSARPPAERFRRPSWRDPRLAVGIVLVLASVIGVVGLVQANDATSPFLVAKHDIAVGDPVGRKDFDVVDMALGSSQQQYLSADAHWDSHAVATQMISSGQMAPTSSIGHTDQLNRKPVSVVMKKDLTEGIHSGQSVDLWVAEQQGSGESWADPKKLVTGAEVVRVIHNEDALSASSDASVQVLVDEADLAPVIKASSGDAKVTLVPSFEEGAS